MKCHHGWKEHLKVSYFAKFYCQVIIANEAIAPLAKSQNFTQSHICIVAGKNVFPTTEKLVWTNSQNL